MKTFFLSGFGSASDVSFSSLADQNNLMGQGVSSSSDNLTSLSENGSYPTSPIGDYAAFLNEANEQSASSALAPANIDVHIFRWSNLGDNEQIEFDPALDMLFIDDDTISAANLDISFNGATGVSINVGAKVVLLSTSVERLSTSNFRFANGSLLVISDGVVAHRMDAAATALANPGAQPIDIKGTNFDDLLLGTDIPGAKSFMAGLGGDNTLRGRSGLGVADYIDTPVSLVEGLSDSFFFASLTPMNNSLVTVGNPYGGTDTLINIRGISGTNAKDQLMGSAADDYFWGNGGDDFIDGGDGVDWVSYSRDPAGVIVNLAVSFGRDGWDGAEGFAGLGGRDVLVNVENVEGSNEDDLLIGDGGDNELLGFGGSDVFQGLAGNDVIDGGAGDDTAIYRGRKSEYVVTKMADGVYTVQDRVAGRDGTDMLTNVENVMFSDETMAPGETGKTVAGCDVDGDGKSDILLQNSFDGICFVWEMHGLDVKASGVVGWTPPSNAWHAVGTGDFDGDGESDILLQNGDDGMCFTWQMDGLSVKGSGIVGWTPPTNRWNAVGTGDFDGDGKSDILLQNGDDGMCFTWEMDGLIVKASGIVGWTPPTNRWHAVATGDFDGDGKSDILLQNGDDGMCFVWEMDGLTVKASGVVGWTPPTAAWHAVGTGDFNGDGKSDILLQNGADGMCFVWEMDGLAVKDSGVVGWTPPTNRWHAVGAGDFDSDGKSDILLQNADDGMCFVWEMDGLTVKSSAVVGWTPPSADWHASV